MRHLVMIAFCTSIMGCAAQQPPVAQQMVLSDVDLRELTAQEKISLGKSLASSLKDPESARFEWTKIPKNFTSSGFDYCARVNSKNSYGGYVGTQPFYAFVITEGGRIKTGQIIGVGSTESDRVAVLTMCRQKGLDPFAPGN